jgi:Phage terminase large subunit
VSQLPTLRSSYTPRGAAATVFSAREPEVLLEGPAGTGKSLACLHKLNAMCLLNPGMRALIVRKTQVTLPSSALSTFRKMVIPQLIAAHAVKFHGGGPQDPPQYRYLNGSVVNIGGMDKASKVLSTEYDWIYVQEATELTEDDWDTLLTRLRGWTVSFQQIVADCNPAQPTHWLNQRQGVRRLPSRHADNPALFDEQGALTERGTAYMATLDRLTGVRRARLRDGIWAAAEGIVYDEWDDAVNLLDPFDIPPEWDRYWAVDFGFTHPFVLQCWAVDPDGRLYLYREIFRTKTLVEDHAKTILKAVTDKTGAWKEPKPRAIICDHDAEGRATLAKHLGMSTTPARKAVSEGIQAVQARIRRAGDGKPRIFILRGATLERDGDLTDSAQAASTHEEIAGYVWTTGLDGRAMKEEPVKEHDDGMDAMRYIVMHLQRGSLVPKIRVMRY